MAHPRLYLLIYDIADDAARARTHKLLSRYGAAVQHSAFEARLEHAEVAFLAAQVEKLIDPAADSFVIYPLARADEDNIIVVGRARPHVRVEDYFLV